MRALYQRFVRIFCAAALAAALVPAAPAVACADDGDGAVSASEAARVVPSAEGTPSAQTAQGSPSFPSESAQDSPWDLVLTDTLQTSVEQSRAIAPFALTSSGAVALRPGNYQRWIDRVDVPDYARQFYAVLEEAADNDGYRDFLIDDGYYNGTAYSEGAFVNVNNTGTIYVGTETAPSLAAVRDTAYAMNAYAMAALAAFDRDHPEVFWLSGWVSVGFMNQGTKVSCYFVLSTDANGTRSAAYGTQYDVKRAIWNRDQWVRQILQGVKKGATQEEAIRHFNRYLTTNNEYNTNSAAAANRDPWVCISALQGRVGREGPVCEGYSRAFKVLCDWAHIPCVLEDGYAEGNRNEPHMWNAVQLAGKWYGVDVTWNDPVVGGASGKVSGYENEDYLLAGSTTLPDSSSDALPFARSHPVSNCAFNSSDSYTAVFFVNGPQLSATAFDRTATPSATASIALPPVTSAPQRYTKLAAMTLSKTSFSFTGKAQRPAVAVTAGGRTLRAGVDYTVSMPLTAKKPGTYTVTARGRGNYTGALSKTFKIKAPALKQFSKKNKKKVTLKAQRKALKVTWKKASGSGKLTGYQVQVATNKKFTKGVKSRYVKGASKTTCTMAKLKAKKRYYVRVRPYYEKSGTKVGGNWSSVKTAKTR